MTHSNISCQANSPKPILYLDYDDKRQEKKAVRPHDEDAAIRQRHRRDGQDYKKYRHFCTHCFKTLTN